MKIYNLLFCLTINFYSVIVPQKSLFRLRKIIAGNNKYHVKDSYIILKNKNKHIKDSFKIEKDINKKYIKTIFIPKIFIPKKRKLAFSIN